MTWKEIKDAIEAQDVTDETVVNYIDISYDDPIVVGNDHTGAVNILNSEQP